MIDPGRSSLARWATRLFKPETRHADPSEKEDNSA